jgi:hypothetical protein
MLYLSFQLVWNLFESSPARTSGMSLKKDSGQAGMTEITLGF